MSEPLPQPRHPGRTVAVTEPSPDLARRNVRFGLALFGLSILIAAGTVLVAFAYLQFD
jgi:hypothetical protein